MPLDEADFQSLDAIRQNLREINDSIHEIKVEVVDPMPYPTAKEIFLASIAGGNPIPWGEAWRQYELVVNAPGEEAQP